MELLHHFQCQFDDFFDLGTWILFDDRLDCLVDVGLAESKHGKCTGGFLDGFSAGGLCPGGGPDEQAADLRLQDALRRSAGGSCCDRSGRNAQPSAVRKAFRKTAKTGETAQKRDYSLR